MQRRPDPLLTDDAWLRAFLRRRVAAADVDDLAQSTWLAALQHSERCRPVLAGIARRLAAMWHRGQRRRLARERAAASAAAAAVPSAQAALEHRETIERIEAAVAALPEPYRATLLQYYQDGHSVAEIARREGLGELAVRKRLQRARDRVRADVEAVPARTVQRRGGWAAGWLWPRRAVAVALGVGVAGTVAALLCAPGGSWATPIRADGVVAAPAPGAALVVPADGAPGPAALREAVATAAAGGQEPAAMPAEWGLAVAVRFADGSPAARAIVRCGHDDVWADAQGVARWTLRGEVADQPDRISARHQAAAGPGGERPRHLCVQDGLRRRLPAGGGDVAFELVFADALRSIRGTVVDATGAPVRGATVFLAEAEPLDPSCPPDGVQHPLEDLTTTMEGEVVLGEGRCASALFGATDADGAFVLPGLRPRPYVLRVVHWQSWRTAVTDAVVAGAESVHITLPDAPARRLRGRVVDPGGAGLADVRVVALLPLLQVGGTPEHVVVTEVFTDAGGAFDFLAPASATEIGVRSAALLRVQQPVGTDSAELVLCTDVPHAVAFDVRTLPAAAASVDLLDVAERPVPGLVPGRCTVGASRQALPGRGVMQVHTRRDAAVARLLTADGRVLQLVPLVPTVLPPAAGR